MDHERLNGLDYANRDNFGHSPEERKEKQAVEETCSLYELQLQDEEAFPALSVCLLRGECFLECIVCFSDNEIYTHFTVAYLYH